MQLLRLRLRHFKGLESFELDLQGRDIKIYGDNETGKTTLNDAFTWILFDKDSQDQTQFEIKTLKENGESLHGLEHEAEMTLELANGKKVELRKIYKEKWVKKRGSAQKTFSGHTTDHFINGVPVNKAEYTAKIDKIADEDIFKLLTNPTYFNEQIHWEERRETLLDVCGNVSDEEVIASNNDLSDLQDILSERSIEEHRKVIKSQQKKINQELDRIPVRIDEVNQSLPDDPQDLDEDSIRRKIRYRKDKIQEKNNELAAISSDGGMSEMNNKLQQVDSELLAIKNARYERFSGLAMKKKVEIRKVQDNIETLNYENRKLNSELAEHDRKIERLESQCDALRKEFMAKANENFDSEGACPTCGQQLPQEQIAKAEKKFNLKKSEKLEKINTEGKSLKAQIAELKGQKKTTEADIAANNERLLLHNETLAQAQSELEAIQKEESSIESDSEYQEKLAEKEAIQAEIESLKSGTQVDKEPIQQDIQSYEKEIEKFEMLLARIEQYEIGKKRIEELQTKEEKLAKEYEKLERQMYLLEEFTRTKVQMLNEKINSKFRLAKFKLFEEQVNGGLKPCCETTYEGVPYNTNLNNGGKINVGLDIIETLAEHYGFHPPIWIDNSESVTDIIPTTGQQIHLVVSEDDKELRVERQEISNEEAV